jgi:hypothetical protein
MNKLTGLSTAATVITTAALTLGLVAGIMVARKGNKRTVLSVTLENGGTLMFKNNTFTTNIHAGPIGKWREKPKYKVHKFESEESSLKMDLTVLEVTIEGHDYFHGSPMTHAQHCPCRAPKEEPQEYGTMRHFEPEKHAQVEVWTNTTILVPTNLSATNIFKQ